MISETDLRLVEANNPQGRWYVHDGFDGWSYGAPQDPTPITRACALRILNCIVEERYPDALSRLAEFPNALVYAEKDDDLYLKTGRNRLIAFVSPSNCAFRERPKPEQDYHL